MSPPQSTVRALAWRLSSSSLLKLIILLCSGDIYNIIWDPIAVEGCEREFSPADYPRVAPLDIGRNVEAKDMTDFFVNFMATDQ